MKLISWAFPVLTIAYLMVLTRLTSSLRNDFGELWQSMGNPGIWNARGQQKILGIVLQPDCFPSHLRAHHWRLIRWVRILGISAFMCFCGILVMISNGAFGA